MDNMPCHTGPKTAHTRQIWHDPVWAIGQPNSAPTKAIHKAAQDIKNPATAPMVLYGGSVNARNVSDRLSLKEIRGLWLGRASLHAKSFFEVYHQAVAAVSAKMQNRA